MMNTLQFDDLDMISSMNLFNEQYPCHIYMICRRPRVIIDITKYKYHGDSIDLSFKIQNKENYNTLNITCSNPFGNDYLEIESEYPYNKFYFKSEGRKVIAKTAVFLQNLPRHQFHGDFLDLEVLYIGQSYGVNGARTAPERLKRHETLQAIYAESLNRNPDQEIWLMLLSFEQIGITVFDGKTKFNDAEKELDMPRSANFFHKIWTGGITEQQFINFTEAALIRFFRPIYNKEYKDTFPNPAHKTYVECYDLDINSVCLEIGTMNSVNVMIYSNHVKKSPIHFGDFLLHDKKERRSMFDFSDL